MWTGLGMGTRGRTSKENDRSDYACAESYASVYERWGRGRGPSWMSIRIRRVVNETYAFTTKSATALPSPFYTIIEFSVTKRPSKMQPA